MAFGTPLTGANESLRFWLESTYNTTPGSPKPHTLPIISHSMGLKRPLGTSRVLRGDPNPLLPPRGIWAGDGQSFVIPVGQKTFGLLLYGLIPTYTKTGAGPYVHTFKVPSDATKRSYGFEIGHTDVSGTNYFDVHLGALMTGFEISVRPTSEEVAATIQVQSSGKHEFANAAQKAAPTTYWDEEWARQENAKIKIGGSYVSYVTEATLRGNRAMDMIPVIDGTSYSDYVIPRAFELSGNIKCLMDENHTARDLATGEAESSLAFEFPMPITVAHSVVLTFPEVIFEVQSSNPALNDTGKREVDLDFHAFYANDVGASGVIGTVTNALADYAAIV
jgi:hypothetical protein